MKGNLLEIQDNQFDIIVIDGLNMVHKYYRTLRFLKDSKGRHTGMFYGILNRVYNMKKKYNGKVIFAWDSKPTKRINIDKNYKGTRKHEKPEGFWTEVKELQVLLSLYNIDQYYAESYEADDIAAKIVKDNKGKKILLVSSDNDWFQMLSETVKIFDGGEIFTQEQIEKKNHIDIKSYTLYKAIVGDSGDNIKRIKRVNDEEVYNLCKAINGRLDAIETVNYRKYSKNLKEKLLSNHNLIKKNYKLVKLIDSGYEFEEIEKINDKKRLLNKLLDYEMRSLHKRISYE